MKGPIARVLARPVAVLVAVLTMVLGVLGYERYRRRAFEEFERIVRHRPWELFGAIADQFRRDLSTQRARLLGPGSEWGRRWSRRSARSFTSRTA